MGTAVDVLIGTGQILAAATGTTLPTSTSASTSAFADVGYISEDGVVQSIGEDTKDIKAWSGDTVRTVQTSHALTYKFTMIETNPTALAAYYGSDNVNDTTNIVQIKAGQGQRQAWIIDLTDGTNRIRITIPDGQVTQHGDVLLKNDEAIGYDVTITCYPDASSVKAYEYLLAAGIS